MSNFTDEASLGFSFEELVEQYWRFHEWLRGVSRSFVGREFRTLVRVRLEVLSDMAAARAKDSVVVEAQTKSSHWARLVVIKEVKVLSDALNLYFNASSPEKWHFKRAEEGLATVAKRVDMERAIRQQELPSWVALPLRQAVASDMNLSNLLPRPTDVF